MGPHPKVKSVFDSAFWRVTPKRLAEDWKLVLGLAFVLLAFYLPNLGGYGLYDPWETHYGEVARNMMETDNYIDPWWGSPWDVQDVKRERAGFYSKPPLIMWMMAVGMQLVGYNELGVRLFFPLLAVLALLSVYLTVSRFVNRRGGLLATAVLASAPFYAFLSRQAVTDGPMVAIIVMGMMAIAYGLFGVEDEDEPPGRVLYWTTIALVVAISGWQLYAMWPMDRSPDIVRPYTGGGGPLYALQWWLRELWTVGAGKGWLLALLLVPVLVWATLRVARQRQRRLFYVYLFYICCGLTVPAKGWLGWAPMGGALLGYLLVSGDWKVLAKVDIPGGLLLVFVIGHPWVIAMLGGHHPAWAKRFWIHDHVNRLFAGVHSTDDGGFEYFLQWIGYGLFPWVALLPAGLMRVFGNLRRRVEGYTPRERFELLVTFWAIFSFFLFSKSSTKFHHYIFPCVPALAILVALYLEDIFAGRAKAVGLFAGFGGALALWVGQDLFRMPGAYGQGSQHLVNLFTYKYDREWPTYTRPEALAELTGQAQQTALESNAWLASLSGPVLWITVLAIVGLALVALFRQRLRSYGLAAFSVAGVSMGGFCLHTYLPTVSEHWSQADLWSAYYAHCTPFEGSEADWSRHILLQSNRVPSKGDVFPKKRCLEPIVAFRMNWRGETFYSGNTVLPVIETKQMKPFLTQWGEHKPFYLFTERSRIKSELEPNLPKHLKGQYTEVFGKNLKFVLLRVEEGSKPSEPAAPEKGTR